MTAIGYVTHNPEKGTFKGSVRTVNFNTPIDIIPVLDKAHDKQPDFRVITDQGFEIGAGWNKKAKSSGNDYISLSLSAPELPRKIYANLGVAAGQDDPDVYALIWNSDS